MSPASEEPKPTTQEQKSLVPRGWQWFKNVPPFWKGIGGLVTTIATILTIVAWLFPSLPPQPPSSETWVEVSKLEEGPHITLERFIQGGAVPEKAKRDADSLFSKEDRERIGSVIRFEVQAK